MPYISQDKRDKLAAGHHGPSTAGELNYLVTMLCAAYMEADKEPNYTKLNEIIGVLECAKLEFYRRIVADYEDDKLEDNGDVY